MVDSITVFLFGEVKQAFEKPKVLCSPKNPLVLKSPGIDVTITSIRIWVREAPENGKANAAIIEALSNYLRKPKSSCVIKSGHTAKTKTIEYRDKANFLTQAGVCKNRHRSHLTE
ncbi:MAG: DUF167 domain-containing protein [Candidatus Omnitrophica bacterium]|nr:DUF167 domain-containing protein [Candidatus Omnitrophota bacterium]